MDFLRTASVFRLLRGALLVMRTFLMSLAGFAGDDALRAVFFGCRQACRQVCIMARMDQKDSFLF